CIAGLNDKVLALDVAELAQTLPECLLTGMGRRGRGREVSTEPTDPMHVRRLLRVGDERRHEQAEGEGDEEPDTAARHGNLLRAWPCGGILRQTSPKFPGSVPFSVKVGCGIICVASLEGRHR